MSPAETPQNPAHPIGTAMVLAAGLGQRMRPLTDVVPKPLVRLGGRPLIDHVLDRICDAGITRAVVNVHYRADQVEAHLAARHDIAITISDERTLLLDTGGGVQNALPLIGNGPFLIHNSDSVWLEGPASNIRALCEAWDGATMDALLMLASGARSMGYDGMGDFLMEPDGRIRRRPEGGVAPFVFTGVSIAHPRLFENSEPGVFSLNREWDEALHRGRVYGTRLDGYWMHVGTPDALAEAERCLKHGEAY